MKPTRRSIGALCAFFVVAAAAVGCGGDDVPGNAVATVNGTAVTRSDFDHWMTVFAKSSASQAQQGGSSTTTSTVPDPPDYAACVKAKRAAAAKTKSKARPTDAQLKKQCATEYTTLRDQALGLLIASKWLEGEATDQGIKVTPAEVTKSIDTQRKEQYPKEADFQKALKDAGFTMEDLRFQTRLQQLQEKLVAKISKGAKAPTAQQISAYYEKNKSQFGSAETRDLHIVLTKDKATAEKAKQAIEGGDSWSSVAKKYSTDDASKSQGGKLTRHEGQPGARLRRRGLRGVQGRAHRPDQDAVRLLRREGRQHQEGHAAVAAAGDADHQAGPRPSRPSRRRSRTSARRTARSGRRRPTAARATSSRAARTARSRRRRPPRRRRRRRPSSALRDGSRDAALGCGPVSRPDITAGPRPPRRPHAAAARRVPVGPRAGRAHDRPAHRRGGLRARRRRQPRRRRQAAGRARRRALPGPLPRRCCMEERGAGDLAAGGRALPRRS